MVLTKESKKAVLGLVGLIAALNCAQCVISKNANNKKYDSPKITFGKEPIRQLPEVPTGQLDPKGIISLPKTNIAERQQYTAATKNHPYFSLTKHILDNQKDHSWEQLPPLEYVLAIINIESRGSQAFYHDPMQIANEKDYALSVIQSNKPHLKLFDDNDYIKTIKHTPYSNRNWNYEASNITPEISIRAGIAWLQFKTAKFELDGRGQVKVTEWRSWDEGVKRYNGGGNSNYMEKFYNELTKYQ